MWSNNKEKSALIAMSGGVDSSVAAYLMQQRGFRCEGTTMRLYRNADIGLSQFHSCCSQLDMPYEVLDFTMDFKSRVMEKFVRVYESGGTPNPCIDCNRYMKFDSLLRFAEEKGLENIVTGHYARAEFDSSSGRYLLKKALDLSKEQSYVLYMLTQEQLSRTIFPLGELKKAEVRESAEQLGFVNARKHDSQDICFVPDGDYAKIIAARTGKEPQPGPFLDLNGNVVGTHRGIIHYTVGQRRGLRMPSDGKIYVVRILPEQNAVVVGPDSALYTNECFVANMHWISGEAPAFPYRCSAKTRYRQPERPCTVYPAGQTGVRLVFDEPLRAITPGQSAVLYDGDTVLGGGIIAREAAEC